jgi:hypothetical protein
MFGHNDGWIFVGISGHGGSFLFGAHSRSFANDKRGINVCASLIYDMGRYDYDIS